MVVVAVVMMVCGHEGGFGCGICGYLQFGPREECHGEHLPGAQRGDHDRDRDHVTVARSEARVHILDVPPLLRSAGLSSYMLHTNERACREC
jgi:hypothetical protein